MSQSKRDRIAARAYEIWEEEGRPPDKAEEHWFRAEQEVAREEKPPQMGSSSGGAQADTRPAPPVQPAPPLDHETAQRPERKRGLRPPRKADSRQDG